MRDTSLCLYPVKMNGSNQQAEAAISTARCMHKVVFLKVPRIWFNLCLPDLWYIQMLIKWSGLKNLSNSVQISKITHYIHLLPAERHISNIYFCSAYVQLTVTDRLHKQRKPLKLLAVWCTVSRNNNGELNRQKKMHKQQVSLQPLVCCEEKHLDWAAACAQRFSFKLDRSFIF